MNMNKTYSARNEQKDKEGIEAHLLRDRNAKLEAEVNRLQAALHRAQQPQHDAQAAYKSAILKKAEGSNVAATEEEGDAFTHGYFCGQDEAIASLFFHPTMRGVRVDGDNIVISVKGGNEAARKLCSEIVAMIENAKKVTL